MGIHPQLWPAVIGAGIGLPLVIWLAYWYAKRWAGFSVRKRWIFGVAIALLETAYWLNCYAWLIEPRQLVVREVTIESTHWKGAPLRIAALSDTHVGGPHVSVARLEGVVRRINALRPDIVVLLGDYAPGHAPEEQRSGTERQEIEGGIATLARLTAPLGVVAVIGNHDSWYNRATITRALEDAGIATLWNRNVEISRPDGDFIVAGLEDMDTGHPDFAAARDGAPDGADTIVISHSPDPFAEAPDDIALMLAAHTHCGQVTIPFIGRPIVPSRYGERFACGRIDERRGTLYVTGGLGTSVAPVRFLNPPEIVIITLKGVDTASMPN